MKTAGAAWSGTLAGAAFLITACAADNGLQQEPAAGEAHPVATRDQVMTQAQRFERAREIARLVAVIDRINRADGIRHTYIDDTRARQRPFSTYLDAWRAKVEEIGHLNYPEEALRRNLSGAVILDVAINADGTLNGVRVLRSSGHEVLDDAAVRIVRLAAPFPPLPEAIRRGTDILHIPRVWRFETASGGEKEVR